LVRGDAYARRRDAFALDTNTAFMLINSANINALRPWRFNTSTICMIERRAKP
jgi:hypothetical protein